jgi:hypothetical protein
MTTGEIIKEFREKFRVLNGVPFGDALEEYNEEIIKFWREKLTLLSEGVRNEDRKTVEGMKQIQKPTHGTCCTCQTCGGDNDYCDCPRNKVLDEVLSRLSDKGANPLKECCKKPYLVWGESEYLTCQNCGAEVTSGANQESV